MVPGMPLEPNVTFSLSRRNAAASAGARFAVFNASDPDQPRWNAASPSLRSSYSFCGIALMTGRLAYFAIARLTLPSMTLTSPSRLRSASSIALIWALTLARRSRASTTALLAMTGLLRG
jgi:hypothetical protein